MTVCNSTRPTLATIAERAGVSRQVVSAILGISGRGSVRYSGATAARVQRIVRSTRFRPNRTAKNLVKKRHGALGILVANFGSIHDGVLRTMLTEAHAHGQLLMLDEMPQAGEALPVFVAEDAVDGLVTFEDIDRRLEREIERLAMPCVRVNANVRNRPGCITYDELGAMRMAVEHLRERGRRAVGFLAGASDHYSMRLRLQGVHKACSGAGLAPPTVLRLAQSFYFGPAAQTAISGISAFLREHPRLDAMVLAVDSMAPVFYRACARAGRRVGPDISVVGVNNSAIALGVLPSLTSLYVEPRRVGELAVKLVNEAIDGAGAPGGPLNMEYTLVIRESTRE